MSFSMKLTPRVEHMLWGAAGGAAALAFVGFYFAGYRRGIMRRPGQLAPKISEALH